MTGSITHHRTPRYPRDASALADLNGDFRFPDIALDVGVAEFRVVALDPESGLESAAGAATFLRSDPDPDAPANAVLEWIEIALETIADSGTTPDYAPGNLHIMAFYD